LSESITRHSSPISHSCTCLRKLSSSPYLSTAASKAKPPPTHDRGPPSKEDTQTDFGALNILGNTPSPATSIDACVTDGFHLNNGIKTSGGSGVLLLGGEAFTWRPWITGKPTNRIGELLSKTGIINLPQNAWGLLSILYPKPDLLILGTGAKLWMLSKETREALSGLGIRVDVMDTGNAAAAYNLLATERGVDGVGAALLPVGWKGR
jgi:NADH dehydrogenase [ubiquinone] 1 alpha subcomplex assembly factor 3